MQSNVTNRVWEIHHEHVPPLETHVLYLVDQYRDQIRQQVHLTFLMLHELFPQNDQTLTIHHIDL